MRQRDLGRTGLQVSILGYGASPLGGEFGDIDEQEGIHSVHRAIELGINFFDTAPFYGRTRSETVLGEALEGSLCLCAAAAAAVPAIDTVHVDFRDASGRKRAERRQRLRAGRPLPGNHARQLRPPKSL